MPKIMPESLHILSQKERRRKVIADFAETPRIAV